MAFGPDNNKQNSYYYSLTTYVTEEFLDGTCFFFSNIDAVSMIPLFTVIATSENFGEKN